MPTSGEVDNEIVTGVNPRFVVVAEEEILQAVAFLECVVLSPSLYMQVIQLFSSISVNIGP